LSAVNNEETFHAHRLTSVGGFAGPFRLRFGGSHTRADNDDRHHPGSPRRHGHHHDNHEAVVQLVFKSTKALAMVVTAVMAGSSHRMAGS